MGPSRLFIRNGLLAAALGVVVGCSLLVEVDDLSSSGADAGSANADADTTTGEAGVGNGSDGSAGANDGGNGNDGGVVVDDKAIAFGGVTAQGLYAENCPCMLTAPVVGGDKPLMVFAVSVNAHDEHIPDIATYNNVELGPPDETLRVQFTRLAVWHLTSPPSAGTFTIRWGAGGHTENAVMMAAFYTHVDQTNPYRSPPEEATGPQPPAILPSPSGFLATDRIVSFFALNDTSNSRGLTAARVGALQTFRAQQVNDSEESQLALSDSPIDPSQNPHRWDYVSDSPWTGIALLLAHAP